MQDQQFSQQFFFPLTSFFSFPPLCPFSDYGAQRVIQDCKLPRALQLAHKREMGWQECPSHESGGCNQLKAGRAHHGYDPYLPFPSFSPWRLQSPALISPQCRNGAVPWQVIKPCALRSFKIRTRKVGDFGETEIKTSSCGRQNYFSSLLPPNLSPA